MKKKVKQEFKIRERIFLNQFSLEDYLYKELLKEIEYYKLNGCFSNEKK